MKVAAARVEPIRSGVVQYPAFTNGGAGAGFADKPERKRT